MAKRPKQDEIFNVAAELKDAAKRAEYLADACGDDSQLRAEVEELLNLDEEAGSFLAAPAVGPPPTLDTSITESPGTVIGPYRLMEQIGEGGFGLVFVADQQHPLRRRVALKVIKPGMDSKEIIARFEAERQALALMDHPNIARVFDAGTTASGRPFFVMELVKGIPIVDYCDRQRLSTRQRLELFIVVCHAVQHAHAKGIRRPTVLPRTSLTTCNMNR